MHLIKMTHPKIRGDNGNHRTEDKLKGLSQNQRPKPGTKAAQFLFLYLPQRQCVLPLHLPVEFFPGNLQIIEISCWHNPSVLFVNVPLICLTSWRHLFSKSEDRGDFAIGAIVQIK